ncbi:MAG: TIGR00730 family Rossman fold protein [Patescibacteria group bacterium]
MTDQNKDFIEGDKPTEEKQIINVALKDAPVRTITKKELHETAVERTHHITREFTDSFNFLKKFPKSVSFFGGERINEDDPYYEKTRSLANLIVKRLNYAVVTGGGRGIMEAANMGAAQAGGKSIGLTIELPNHLIQNAFINANLNFHYFFSRKVALAFAAEAYIFLPGGFGTFDEFFEILTLVQTKKIEAVPIILVGGEFWRSFDEVIKKEMLTRGTIDEHETSLYTITDDEEEIIQIIQNAPVRNGIDLSTHTD